MGQNEENFKTTNVVLDVNNNFHDFKLTTFMSRFQQSLFWLLS